MEIFSWSSAFGTFGRPGWITSTSYTYNSDRQETHTIVRKTAHSIRSWIATRGGAIHHTPHAAIDTHSITTPSRREGNACRHHQSLGKALPWGAHRRSLPSLHSLKSVVVTWGVLPLSLSVVTLASACTCTRALHVSAAYHLATRQERVAEELAGAHRHWNLISHSFCWFCCENGKVSGAREWKARWPRARAVAGRTNQFAKNTPANPPPILAHSIQIKIYILTGRLIHSDCVSLLWGPIVTSADFKFDA